MEGGRCHSTCCCSFRELADKRSPPSTPRRMRFEKRKSLNTQHHVIAATQSLFHDTNSLDAESTEALIAAKRAVALIKELPSLVRISPLSPPH